MKVWDEQIYRYLPAVYQIRDGEVGEPLKMLLTLVGEQAQLVQDDIEQLYDNWFIESCQDWVVPYIGDLVGFRGVEDAGQPGDPTSTRAKLLNHFLFPRRQIANLVARRRRKGTLSVLEDVAKDVAGWSARAVEFSRLVAFFQNVQHPEPTLGHTLCIRDRDALARADTPFDRLAHTIDVREIQPIPGIGWYHPYKLGLFVWRRNIYSATDTRPCRLCSISRRPKTRAVLYSFNRIGVPAPLYVNPVQETNELGLADERNLPVPLYRYLLRESTGHASSDFYGLRTEGAKSVSIRIRWTSDCDWEVIPNSHVHVCSLPNRSQCRRIARRLSSRHVVIDPERGLLLTKSRTTPFEVRASSHYAFSANMGGGEYERANSHDGTIPIIRLRSDECAASPEIPKLFKQASDYLGNGNACLGCGLERALYWKEPSTTPDKEPQPSDADSHDKSVLVPQRTTANVKEGTGKQEVESVTGEWHVTSSISIELHGSDTWQIACDEPLHIHDYVTLEIRAANGSWPMIKIRRPRGKRCDQVWRVQMGKGSRLIVDGVLICGAAVSVEDLAASGHNKKQGPSCGNQPSGNSACVSNDPSTVDCRVLELENPTEVIIRHATFVPGGRTATCCQCQPNHASLIFELEHGHICIRHSIVGTMTVKHRGCESGSDPELVCPYEPLRVHIADSIVDAAYGMPAIHAPHCRPAHADLIVERSTVLGDVCIQQITRAEDSLFVGIVHVQRRGHGYMRFCFAPQTTEQVPVLDDGTDICRAYGAIIESGHPMLRFLRCRGWDRSLGDWCYAPRMPRRFKCLPETTEVETDERGCAAGCGTSPSKQSTPVSEALPKKDTAIRPIFISTEYGHPGYCQLALDCPTEILRGAEDQSEMGVFHDLYYPQRGAALAARLQEYTPAETHSAVIYSDDLHPATFRQLPSPCQQD